MDELELEVLEEFSDPSTVAVAVYNLGNPIGAVNIEVIDGDIRVTIFNINEDEIDELWYSNSTLRGIED